MRSSRKPLGPKPSMVMSFLRPVGRPGKSGLRGLARNTWAPNGHALPVGSLANVNWFRQISSGLGPTPGIFCWLPGTNGLPIGARSEEHTSELQSHHDLVCRLLLEKKKKKQNIIQ